RSWRWVGLAAAIAACYGIVTATAVDTTAHGAPPVTVGRANDRHDVDWKPWSEAAVAASVKTGHPVFVDFTAAWCVTCQANKRLVLHSRRVRDEFEAHHVTRLVAD